MDAERFDRIAKSLAASASRRRLLGGLAALAAVGRGTLGPEDAGAQDVPGLPDGSGPTTQATDPTCKGEPAFNNRICPANRCTANANCFCGESAGGNKRCVKVARDQFCPQRDQCDRNRHCGKGEACMKVGACCGHPERNFCLPLCD